MAVDRKQQMKEITERLEQGVKDIFTSEMYTTYLRTMAKFHNYSFNNTLLIAMQQPDATLVAGFNAWKNKFNRYVKKGEKGIQIIAPAPIKEVEEREKIDKDTGLAVLNENGEPEMERVEYVVPRFRVTTVFDVSQTDGEPIPSLEVNELTASVKDYALLTAAIEQVSPVPMRFDEIKGDAKGYYSDADKEICIQVGMGESQTVKTMIHEVAHAMLHNSDFMKKNGEEKDRLTKETEAESIAFQQMMDGVRNGKIDTIIVKDLSRFGRDYIGVGEYMEQIFPLLGVRLIAINDNYDSNNYKGTTLGMDVVVSNLVNTMYCRDAGKKLRTANQVKWRKGITTASAAPFGYQFDPDEKGAFIIDPPAAKIVRRIFDLAILGLGTREIAMILNDENVPVPSVYNKENKAYGKETTYTIAPVILWDSSRVWKILTAYVYTGAMVLGKTKTLISGKSIIRTVPKGQQYITEGTHEAIVSREEFEKAQLVIKSNSHKVLMGSVDFPLKGKVRCGNCRRVMAHNFKQVVPTFWCREGLELVGQTQCTSEIFQVSDIESAVFQALKKELSLLDSLYGDIQKEEQDLKEAHKKANRRKTLMEQELKNLKGEKMRMYEEYAAGTLPLDTYKQKKQECDRRISEVQEQIEQSKAEESVQSVVPGTVRAAAEQAENFLNGTRLTAGMVSAFIENVFVYGDGRIVVRFKYEQSIQDAARALHKS